MNKAKVMKRVVARLLTNVTGEYCTGGQILSNMDMSSGLDGMSEEAFPYNSECEKHDSINCLNERFLVK
jgi:hypothetical protein